MLNRRGLVVLMTLGYLCFMFASVQAAFAADVPALLITEVLPNAKNVPHPVTGANFTEAYEMVELYNNSGKDIVLKDYQMVVTEPGKADIIFPWKDEYKDKVVPAGGVLVVWFRATANPFTLDYFYKHYLAKNPDLQIDQIAVGEVAGGYMTNSTPHTIWVRTAVGADVCAASFTGSGDTVDDRPIKYAYPTDGSINMRAISWGSSSLSTPGIVEEGQVPAK